jgi:RNA polymerase sigma factor (sigma-70 family)
VNHDRVEHASFATTHWSVVLEAGRGAGDGAAEALERLCAAYWYPLYAFVRRRGASPQDAEDLTQEFFLRLLDRGSLSTVQREGGRFRSFLLTAFKRFLANEHERRQTLKRGGGHAPISLDELSPEERYRAEPLETLSPEVLFDRRWAGTLLDRAMSRLRAEQVEAGKGRLFERLKPCLSGGEETGAYAPLAGELGMSEDAIKMTAHRLRRRYGELLRAEVAQTVSTAAEIEEELRYLIAATR